MTSTHGVGIVVVMGVSGCGKTSVGKRIAAHFDMPFLEGDTLHPRANIAKMEAGKPLTDDDRWPWLETIAERMASASTTGLVVSCSALKRSYRDKLRFGAGRPVKFVFLKGSEAVLSSRMHHRTGHFMPSSLLTSQLATLEDPSGEPLVVAVDVEPPLEEVVATAVAGLEKIAADG